MIGRFIRGLTLGMSIGTIVASTIGLGYFAYSSKVDSISSVAQITQTQPGLTTDQELMLTDVALMATQQWLINDTTELWAFVAWMPTSTAESTPSLTPTVNLPFSTATPFQFPTPTQEFAEVLTPSPISPQSCRESGTFVPSFKINTRSAPMVQNSPSNVMGSIGQGETIMVCTEMVRNDGRYRWMRIAGMPEEWFVYEEVGGSKWGVLEIWPD